MTDFEHEKGELAVDLKHREQTGTATDLVYGLICLLFFYYIISGSQQNKQWQKLREWAVWQ